MSVNAESELGGKWRLVLELFLSRMNEIGTFFFELGKSATPLHLPVINARNMKYHVKYVHDSDLLAMICVFNFLSELIYLGKTFNAFAVLIIRLSFHQRS